jgi:DNA-binding transcriptional LysR family regulator
VELDQLRTFLAVLDHGSFTRAAAALHVVQSTVSFQIKALETASGTKLIDRAGGRVRPTAAGRTLRRFALRMVALEGEARASMRAQDGGQVGHVVIAASTTPAEWLLPRILRELRASRPGIGVTVNVSDSRKAEAALLAEECDVAFVGSAPRDRRVASQAIASDEVVLIGPTGGPLARNRRVSADELARLPLILREEGSGTRRAVTRILARRAAGAPVTMTVGSNEAAKQCVLEGLGLTFISRRAVADDVTAGRLQIIDCPGMPVKRRFYAATLRSVTQPPAVRELVKTSVRVFR